MSRERIFIVTLLCMAVVMIGSASVARSQDVRIDFTPAITGASAAEYSFYIKAIKLALKEINAAGGINGRKIDLRMVDNQSTNPGALAALQKAVEQDKALVLVGFIKSTQVLACSDAIKNYGIPTIIGGTNATLTRQGNPWLFRVRPDDSVAARAMVTYIKENLKLSRVGILHDNDAFGTGGADMVERYSKEQGLTVVKRERYTTKDKDYTAELLSLKNAGTQVMVAYATNPEDVAVIIRQYRQLGSPYKYIGSPSTQQRAAINLSREEADGILAVADLVPGVTEADRRFGEAYRKEYNEPYDSTSGWTYDGLYILANAIRKAGDDRAKIREAILAIHGYKGVLGTYDFSPNGDGLHEVSVVQIEKGETKLVRIINVGAK